MDISADYRSSHLQFLVIRHHRSSEFCFFHSSRILLSKLTPEWDLKPVCLGLKLIDLRIVLSRLVIIIINVLVQRSWKRNFLGEDPQTPPPATWLFRRAEKRSTKNISYPPQIQVSLRACDCGLDHYT